MSSQPINTDKSNLSEAPDPIDYYRLVKKAIQYAFQDDQKWIIDVQNEVTPLLCMLQGYSSCSGTVRTSLSSFPLKPNCGTISKPVVEELVKAATPAPFGKGDKTVYDESIRKGLELKAKDLEIVEDNFKLEKLVVENIPEINTLAPRYYKLTPHLYKMHIYQAGGHFEEHMDTPHAPNHIATLVMCLPSAFEGGELVVQDGEESKVYALQQNEIDKDKSYWPSIPWVAFYTDCKHRVNPVTFGTRVLTLVQATRTTCGSPSIASKEILPFSLNSQLLSRPI